MDVTSQRTVPLVEEMGGIGIRCAAPRPHHAFCLRSAPTHPQAIGDHARTAQGHAPQARLANGVSSRHLWVATIPRIGLTGRHLPASFASAIPSSHARRDVRWKCPGEATHTANRQPDGLGLGFYGRAPHTQPGRYFLRAGWPHPLPGNGTPN
jgi:hypothetical protein